MTTIYIRFDQHYSDEYKIDYSALKRIFGPALGGLMFANVKTPNNSFFIAASFPANGFLTCFDNLFSLHSLEFEITLNLLNNTFLIHLMDLVFRN